MGLFRLPPSFLAISRPNVLKVVVIEVDKVVEIVELAAAAAAVGYICTRRLNARS